MKGLAITLMYCSRLHAWCSAQSRMAALLSSLIARWWVGLRALRRFQLKDLSIDEMVGAWCFGCCLAHRGLSVGFILLRCLVYLLLSPCLCFVSFLYLDLYVLGDVGLVGWGSFMQARHLCVLVLVWAGGGVCAPLGQLRPSSKVFLLAVPGQCFICGSFLLFLSCFVMLSCTSVC